MDISVTSYLEHRSRSTQPALAAFGLSGGSAGLLAPGASSCCTLGTSIPLPRGMGRRCRRTRRRVGGTDHGREHRYPIRSRASDHPHFVVQDDEPRLRSCRAANEPVQTRQPRRRTRVARGIEIPDLIALARLGFGGGGSRSWTTSRTRWSSPTGSSTRTPSPKVPSRNFLPPRLRGWEVGQATLRRRSIRTFTGDQVPASELAAILRSSLAVTGVADVPLSDGSTVEYWYRAAPSGGGLYPVEAYIAVFRVDGLEPGVYRYSPRLDSLITVGDTGMGDAIRASLTVTDDQMSVSGAAAMVVLVGVPWRSMRKYGPRGLRFVFHEAGGIAGYMHLAATALGVGSSDCASYYDDQVNGALGLDGLSRLAIHTILLGTPT